MSPAIATRPITHPAGLFIVEVLIYISIVMVTIGGLGASAMAICRTLHERTQGEQTLKQWTEVSELLRDDIRAAKRIEWRGATAPAGSGKFARLRLVQSGGRVVEYSVEIQGSQDQPDGARKTQTAPTPRTGTEESHTAAKPVAIPAPPRLIRSTGDETRCSAAQLYPYFDLIAISHSKTSGEAWDLQHMQPGESVDASTFRTFFEVTLQFQSPNKAPREFSTGACTRSEKAEAPGK